jgi:hypothetical protein
VVNTAPDGKVTAKHVAEVVERTSSKGMRFRYDEFVHAHNAIADLQKIFPTAPRRKEAFDIVRRFMDANP